MCPQGHGMHSASAENKALMPYGEKTHTAEGSTTEPTSFNKRSGPIASAPHPSSTPPVVGLLRSAIANREQIRKHPKILP